MPPWGRPPGGYQGMRRRDADGIYRFQELDSDDDGQGVLLDPLAQKNRFMPGELFFNDFDSRNYDPRLSEQDELAYGDEYGLSGEEDYFEEQQAGVMHFSPADQEEFLVQRAMERIRKAKAKGKASVNLTHEELEAMETRRVRQQQEATPQRASAKSRSPAAGASVRSKKTPQKTSIFGSPVAKSKSSKSSRKPVASTSEEVAPAPAPGFVVPGSSGNPVYAPVGYGSPRRARATSIRSTSSPSRPGSRSASSSRNRTTSISAYDAPGAFPSGPVPPYPRYPSDPGNLRPPSSSSRHSSLAPDELDYGYPRSRSSSNAVQYPPLQQAYPTYQVDPHSFAYNPAVAGSVMAGGPSPYLQGRRVPSNSSDVAYAGVPRRVPVGANARIPASNSDPVLGYRASGLGNEVSEDDSDSGEGVLVDVVPEPAASGASKGYSVQVGKASGSGSGSGSGNGAGGKGRHRRGRK